MKGHIHAPLRRLTSMAVAGGLLLALLPTAPLAVVASAEALDPRTWPAAPQSAAQQIVTGRSTSPWEVVLDEDGVVAEHQITLRYGDDETVLRVGPRGFFLQAGPRRMLIGERSDGGTQLAMIDISRGCRMWARRVDRLAYPISDLVDARKLRLSMHRLDTGRFEGHLDLEVETGASGGMIDGVCITDCEPNDGDLSLSAYLPAGAARPVPSFAAGGWAAGKVLTYRWGDGAVPPTWARDALRAAADDAGSTSGASGPRFVYRSDASDSVRYTGAFPSYCSRSGIACAARNMPTFWGVWLRPHGTDFAWGTLRWCQKDSSSGCFDIRRVLLHELGHVTGLNHPSTAGFTLGVHETVMQAITPAKPKPGSSRHSFGRCDVATLQELYDTPTNQTAISTCNDVTTKLELSAAGGTIDAGASVKLTAELHIVNKSAYGELAGNPLNGRSVKLKYRRAGSDDAWNTAWMRSQYSSGRYSATIAPQQTWEFKATFPAPTDEGLRYSRSEIVKVKVRD